MSFGVVAIEAHIPVYFNSTNIVYADEGENWNMTSHTGVVPNNGDAGSVTAECQCLVCAVAAIEVHIPVYFKTTKHCLWRRQSKLEYDVTEKTAASGRPYIEHGSTLGVRDVGRKTVVVFSAKTPSVVAWVIEAHIPVYFNSTNNIYADGGVNWNMTSHASVLTTTTSDTRPLPCSDWRL